MKKLTRGHERLKGWAASFSKNVGKYVLSPCRFVLWYKLLSVVELDGSISVPRRQRQVDLCECETSLIYITSYRSVRATPDTVVV